MIIHYVRLVVDSNGFTAAWYFATRYVAMLWLHNQAGFFTAISFSFDPDLSLFILAFFPDPIPIYSICQLFIPIYRFSFAHKWAFHGYFHGYCFLQSHTHSRSHGFCLKTAWDFQGFVEYFHGYSSCECMGLPRIFVYEIRLFT